MTDQIRTIAEETGVSMKTVAITLGVLIPLMFILTIVAIALSVWHCKKKEKCFFKKARKEQYREEVKITADVKIPDVEKPAAVLR